MAFSSDADSLFYLENATTTAMPEVSANGNVATIINVILPIWFLFLLGWAAQWRKVFVSEDVPKFSNFVLWFCLPALIFSDLSKIRFTRDVLTFMLWQALGSVTVFAIMVAGFWIFNRHDSNRDMQKRLSFIYATCSTKSSSVFLGKPLILYLYGVEQTVYCYLMLAGNMVTIVLAAHIGLIWFSNSSSRWDTIKSLISKSIFNPVILPVLLALPFALTETNPPDIIENFCEILGSAASGTALFVIGMQFFVNPSNFSRVWGETTVVMCAKHIVTPLVIFLFMCISPTLDYTAKKTAFILNALPPAQIVYHMAFQYKMGTEHVANAIVIGGIISLPLIALYYLILENFESFSYLFHFQPHSKDESRALEQIALVLVITSTLCNLWTGLPSLFPSFRAHFLSSKIGVFVVCQGLFTITLAIRQNGSPAHPEGLCKAQGFFIQFFGVLGNGYFLVIVLELLAFCVQANWKKLLRVLEFVVLAYSLLSSVVLLILDKFHQAGPWCWISETKLQLGAFYAPLILEGVTAVASLLYLNRVWADIYAGPEQESLRLKLAWKLRLMIISFLFLWFWGVSNRLSGIHHTNTQHIPSLFLMHVICISLQGVTTFMVFGWRKEIATFYKDRMWALLDWIRDTFCCCWSRKAGFSRGRVDDGYDEEEQPLLIDVPHVNNSSANSSPQLPRYKAAELTAAALAAQNPNGTQLRSRVERDAMTEEDFSIFGD